MPQESKSPKLIAFLWGLVIAGFLAPVALNIYDHLTRPRAPFSNEKAAILQLLAQKFTGPLYFQPDESSERQPLSADKVYISAASAKSQVQGIARSRKLSAGDAARLNDIIARMTEPSPSRVVGEERVNLLLLNIALDAL